MGQLTKDEVFALAVQRYSDTVFRAAMHNCSCAADAEDVVQDVFEKLLRYEGRFESEEHLKAWLLRVAINRCRDITRAARQKDTELDENIPAPESGNDGSVLDAVRTLPENYRNAVYLHYYEGYTAADHLEALLRHGHEGLIDLCLANNAPIPRGLAARYSEEDAELLRVDRERIAALGIALAEYPLLSAQGHLGEAAFGRIINHPALLAQAVMELYRERTVRIYRGTQQYITEEQEWK